METKRLRRVPVLVEGPSDELLLKKFFNQDKAVLKKVEGSRKIDEIHQSLTAMCVAITITDADFRHLTPKKKTQIDGKFYTDKHDIEMTILSDKEVREQLLKVNNFPHNNIYSDVLDELDVLSYLKWLNFIKCRGHRMRCIKIANLSAEELKDVDLLLSLSSPLDRPSISRTEYEKFRKDSGKVDEYNLTVGHDFICRLCLHMKEKCSHYTNYNEKKVYEHLSNIYKIEMFKQTKLWSDIKSWSNKKGIELLVC